LIFDKVKMWSQKFNNSGKDHLYLGVPILVTVLLKLIILMTLYDSPVNNDATVYINSARQYLMGNFTEGIIIYPQPAYPLLLVLIHFVIPDWIFSGYFISIVSMILATIPLYYLTKTMFDKKAAFWACLIFAILPRMNEWSMNISRDPLFLFLFMSCVYLSLKFIKEKTGSFLL
jgi:4-amino-4-deoxy-L-arabinose transferase-like glycosyltransferase